MPLRKLQIRPGINTQATQTLNSAGLSLSNLIRFKDGLVEKVGGWQKLFAQAAAGIIRRMHAFEDLSLNKTLLLGTDGGAQIYTNGMLVSVPFLVQLVTGATFTPSSGTKPVTVSGLTFNPASGASFTLPQKLSVGGIILAAGSTITATSVSTASFVFQLPSNATNSSSNTGIPVLLFTFSTAALANISIQFLSHGLSVGNLFTFDVTTSASLITGFGTYTFSLTAGTALAVTSVTDANNFVVQWHITTPGSGQTYTTLEGTSFTGNYSAGTITAGAPQLKLAQTVLPGSSTNWSIDNFGNFGIFCQAGGPIYQYTPPLASNSALVNISGTNAPQINAGMFVSMPQAQIIAYGSETVIGGGAQDPLLVRFCDIGDLTTWAASSTNQAGSYHLSRGSAIIGGIQAPQTTLLWTDTDLWSMQYIGPPLVYGFGIIGAGCGLVAQNARATLGRNTYWMAIRSFWMYGDNGVQPIECPVWDQVFPLLDPNNENKIFAVANSPYQEIIFYYPSINGVGEPDSYVKFNVMTNLWDYGSLTRTSGINESIYGTPIFSDINLNVQQHEIGYNNNILPMQGAFLETGYADLSDGDDVTVIDMIIPDFKWLGSGGSVNITLWGTDYPARAPDMFGPFTVTPTTEVIPVSIRKRQIALRIDWGNEVGFSARIGAIRMRAASSGKRP